MTCYGIKLFRSSFRLVCVVGVSLMISYWVYKFKIDDRDIGVVDFVPLDEKSEFKLPVGSLCFKNPFLSEKRNNTLPELKVTTYLKYLKGEIFDSEIQKIRYDDVTINLEDYFLYSRVQLSNETDLRNNSFRFSHKPVFSGMYGRLGEMFVKCYSVEMYDNDIHNLHTIEIFYDLEKMFKDLSIFSTTQFYFNMHYPGKFLIEVHNLNYMAIQPKASSYMVFVKSMELLKRRNSRKKNALTIMAFMTRWHWKGILK